MTAGIGSLNFFTFEKKKIKEGLPKLQSSLK